MIEENYHFICPKEPNAKIWRYVSFTKFVSLLESGSLFFCRSDQFDDPFEGTVPEHVPAALTDFFKDRQFENAIEMAEEFIRLMEHSRLFTFVNCWHLNEGESDAMWKLYSLTHEGVAIQSTVGRLTGCLEKAPDRVFLGAVQYVDIEKADPGIFFNAITPFIYKRRSFEHEQEFRAVNCMNRGADVPPSEESTPLIPGSQLGKGIAVDLNELIEAIVVSPLAPCWYKELVEAILTRFALSIPVSQSRLYRPPDRRQTSTASESLTVELSRETLAHLQAEHLSFMELQSRERERSVARQYELLMDSYREIEKAIAEATHQGADGNTSVGKAVFTELAKEISPLDAKTIFHLPTFQIVYFLAGKIDNLLRDVLASSLHPSEIVLLVRKVIFLYTETLVPPLTFFEIHARGEKELDEAMRILLDHVYRMRKLMVDLNI